MIKTNRALMLGALMAVAAGANAAPSIVYQNLTTVAVNFTALAANGASSLEFGDQVALAGTDRRIRNVRTTFQVGAGGTGNYDFDVNLRFRALDGTTPAGSPLTQIGATQTYQIRGLAQGAGGTAAAWIFNLGVPDILVPDNVLVSLELIRQGGNTGTVGVHFTNDAAEVGASDVNFFWQKSALGTWGSVNFGASPNQRANMALELQAVPEPATMAALGIGVAAMLRRRKKA